MKKYFYLILLVLLLPVVVNAKTITCTSKGTITGGKVLEGSIKVTCSEGKVEVFAYNDPAISFYEKQGYHARCYTDIKKI